MLIGISLKAYLGSAATAAWVRGLRTVADQQSGSSQLVVFPAFTAIETTSRELAESGIRWGAQDVSASAGGAQTGDIPATLLAELGCSYVEIGHAERRRAHRESDLDVTAKARAAVNAGIVPWVCVGESERIGVAATLDALTPQLDAALAGAAGSPLVLAYEPVWAIGAVEPAPADHVLAVAAGIRARVGEAAQLVYGGAAGPGTLTALGDAVDGLFLGRFAHDLTNVSAVLAEAHRAPTRSIRERSS